MVPQHETLSYPDPERRDHGDGVKQEQRVEETATAHRSNARILFVGSHVKGCMPDGVKTCRLP